MTQLFDAQALEAVMANAKARGLAGGRAEFVECSVPIGSILAQA